MEVKIRRGESSENLIKRFIKKIKKEQIVEECLDRTYYKKPCELRREKYFKKLALIEKNKKKEKMQLER